MPIERKNDRRYKRCKLASKIALKYGSILSANLTEDQIEEFCEDGEFVNRECLKRDVSTSNIKWYIRSKMEIDDPIWNADFISGIIKTGKVHWSVSHYPTFKWWGSPILVKVLEDCPYYGKVKDQKDEKHCYSWQQVPALYLNPTNSTKSYVAGLLSTGRLHKDEGVTYALYKPEVMKELKRFGIPLEKDFLKKPRALISPFWPALFTKHMPECCYSYWLNVKKPYMGIEYASILWATHGDHKIVKGGLPYLPSRRKVLYMFKSEKGTLKELQKRRVKHDLLRLDKLVNECLIDWFDSV